MSKKKKKEAARKEQERILMLQQIQSEEAAAAQQEEQRRKSRPLAMEEYYNIAYANERKRLNEMFGRINYGYFPDEEEKPVETIVDRVPDKTKYVPMRQYKKKKNGVVFLTITTLIFAAAAIALAFIHFDIISLFS